MLYGLFNLRAEKRCLDTMSTDEFLGMEMARIAARRIRMMMELAFCGVHEEALLVRARRVGTFLGMFGESETLDFSIPPQTVLMHVKNQSLPDLVDYTGLEIAELIKTYKILGAPQRDTNETGYVFTPILHNTVGTINIRMHGNSVMFPDNLTNNALNF